MITNKESNFISVVCYVYNGEKHILEFLQKLYEILDSKFRVFEIICVNDASKDNSCNIIEEFSKDKDTVISIVNMSSFQGIEVAMDAGTDLAIGDYVYEFDSIYIDYPLELITDVYEKAMEGFDIVAATPHIVHGEWSKFFYSIFNRYRTCEGQIRQERFHIVSRRAINRVNDINKLLVYRKAAYANCGLKSTFIQYENSINVLDYDKKIKRLRKKLATYTIILFTDLIQKVTAYLSAFFLLVTVGIALYTCIVYTIGRKPVEGWTPIMLYLSLGFFGIFLILTVVVKYLSLIINLLFKRKYYLIESIVKLTKN